MKSASKVLIILGSIFSFIGVLVLLIFSIVFFVTSSNGGRDALVEGIKNGTITSSYTGTPEEVADAVQVMARILAMVFLSISLIYLIAPIISLIAMGSDSKTMHIVALVFSILGFDVILILGNIFSIATPEESYSNN